MIPLPFQHIPLPLEAILNCIRKCHSSHLHLHNPARLKYSWYCLAAWHHFLYGLPQNHNKTHTFFLLHHQHHHWKSPEQFHRKALPLLQNPHPVTLLHRPEFLLLPLLKHPHLLLLQLLRQHHPEPFPLPDWHLLSVPLLLPVRLHSV